MTAASTNNDINTKTFVIQSEIIVVNSHLAILSTEGYHVVQGINHRYMNLINANDLYLSLNVKLKLG